MARLSYEVEICHPGLSEYKVVRAATAYEAQMKAQAQLLKWEQKWQRQAERNQLALSKEEGKALAAERTQEAKERMREVEDILITGLSNREPPSWGNLYDRSSFDEPALIAPKMVAQARPKPNASDFPAQLNLLDWFFPSREERKHSAAAEQYRQALDGWKKEQESVEQLNRTKQAEYDNAHAAWSAKLDSFRRRQQEHNQEIDRLKAAFDSGEARAVESYCDLVLARCEFPDCFPHQHELEYRADTRLLVVSYFLPSLNDLPIVKECKYVSTRDELVESHFSESATKTLYDDTIYRTTLRILHELFAADTHLAIDAVVFNGFVDTIDQATGKPVQPCIVSLQTCRSEFEEINLASINAKACFRKLKGVGSSQLHSLASVTPIVMPSREDRRFVDAYDVVEHLDDSCNLAAMNWEDFEHLVRELFEQEFSQAGGDVKVTQASRDGGVDAVAFDPDPIRGGKIVIQAKRYTNVVGVATVRELYGTVINEGASKGVLVTTSQYGPDAYEFAQGKPITLMDGSQLLHLLQRHGHKARIDLNEAKLQLAKSG